MKSLPFAYPLPFNPFFRKGVSTKKTTENFANPVENIRIRRTDAAHYIYRKMVEGRKKKVNRSVSP